MQGKSVELPPSDPSDALFRRAVLRLNCFIFGAVAGLVAAIGLFAATSWLVLKGGPNVGQHLSLLGEFYPGYSVSFLGSLVGIPYALATGFAFGWTVAWLYNRIASWRAS